jgi:hypothetical protein
LRLFLAAGKGKVNACNQANAIVLFSAITLGKVASLANFSAQYGG